MIQWSLLKIIRKGSIIAVGCDQLKDAPCSLVDENITETYIYDPRACPLSPNSFSHKRKRTPPFLREIKVERETTLGKRRSLLSRNSS
jgi:hypothetical protein